MTNEYHDFTERLKALITETGCSLPAEDLDIPKVHKQMAVEITSVREADCPESILEVHAISHDDPVLCPEGEEDLESDTTGAWIRREVRLLVSIPMDSDNGITVKISFSTKNADADGDRLVSFNWTFDDAGEPEIAEMSFHDTKTFKLDYFSVMPPDYVRAFVRLCEQAYGEQQKSFLDELVRFTQEFKDVPPTPN